MNMVEVTVGIGSWSFTARKAYAVVPCVGDDISNGEDAYKVHRRTVCPEIVYIECHVPFASESDANEAGRAWGVK